MNGETLAPNQADTIALERWIEAFRLVARSFQLPWSEQGVRLAAEWRPREGLAGSVSALARAVGLRVKIAEGETVALSAWQLPVIVALDDGSVGVVTTLGAGGEASVVFSNGHGLESPVPLDLLLRAARLVAIPRPVRAVPDARVDAYVQPYRKRWFVDIALGDLRPYAYVLMASLVANLLALAGMLFSMQVYDRVVPAGSYPTLYVLYIGVLLALVFDFILRKMRTRILDLLGKRADLQLSDLVFGHALRVQSQHRPRSTGSFVAQLRDLEQVRELMTSTTVTALVDLPFFLLFLVVYWFLGGLLVLVPLAGFFLLLVPGLLVQGRLREHSAETMREASLRNALLVEAIQGAEDVKTLQAEPRFQQKWNQYNAVSAEGQLEMRGLTSGLLTWTQTVQTLVFASVILAGAPLVMSGEMTTGALVAVSILGSRMMAPLSQVAQLFSRLQQARVSLRSLDAIMRLPVDHPEAERRVPLPAIRGAYRLKSASFRYGDENTPIALQVPELMIRPGERIAVLGRNGAGKSTLLQALSGLLLPAGGEVVLENIALQHADPVDVRRDIGLLTQNARLFYGTIRENIQLGAPNASEAEMLDMLAMVGADDFIRRLAAGLEHTVLEGGNGLSGGQRQAILLARLLIRQPSVVLLDEPTASMDEATERHFISRFGPWSQGRTVVIATHRMRVLELVDRIVVIDGGTVTLDQPKDSALKTLRGVANVATPVRPQPAPRFPAAMTEA